MKRHINRHILSAAVILYLLCILLAACGAKEEEAEKILWQGIAPGMKELTDITERTEYYDVTVESESLFALDLEGNILQEDQDAQALIGGGETVWSHVGTQFFQGEPIQLWVEAGPEGSDIYLYRKDGSRELLLEDFSNEYTVFRQECQWYMDQEGNYYCYGTVSRVSDEFIEIEGDRFRRRVSEGFFVKILSSGEILRETVLGEKRYVQGLCQTEDGGVYVLLEDMTEDSLGDWMLAKLDAAGELVQESVRELPLKFGIHLGKAGSFPAVTGYDVYTDREISRVDMAEGSLTPILYFNGISYGWHDELKLQDFQVPEDGVVEFLWTKSNEAGVLLERLKMEKVEKTPIVVRGSFYGNTWFANRVAQFNRENSTYHVVVEDCGSGNDEEDFARLTSVQISAGKGPDIINGNLMKDYMQGMLEKGALEELTPYMEASGVREEEYFPLTFASLRQGDRIYGVNPQMVVWDYETAEEALGSQEAPDIETLIDALLARGEEGIYCKGNDSQAVLELFLQGSESLWGMVDWENGSCDFNTPLFGRLLEAARRYGDDGSKNFDSIITYRIMLDVLHFEEQAQLEAAGKAAFGTLFDDGCFAASAWGYALAVNANSSRKEGAWEFIRFLISEEAQSADGLMDIPVHREAFDEWVAKDINKYAVMKNINGVYVPTFEGVEITEERQAEFKKRIEEARPLPIRTEPVLEIVLEEAGYYFDGTKSAEDVSGVINKRVQLYLDERK